MPFPNEFKEQIYANICATGVNSGFLVVPEFKFRYQRRDGTRCAKWVDIAWIKILADRPLQDGIPQYRVVAAFEVDGFDVPLPTIELYSDIYPIIRNTGGAEFSCWVPLYSRATHRLGYGSDNAIVRESIALRQARAAQHGNEIIVRNGADPDWLATAVQAAEQVAE